MGLFWIARLLWALVQSCFAREEPPSDYEETWKTIPIASARQYALEMCGLRSGVGGEPLQIGGVRLQYASVKIFPAVLDKHGRQMSIEVRALSVVYPDYRREQYEFDAAGGLLYHVEPYEC